MTVNYSHGDVRFPGDQAGKMGHIHIIHENEAWLDLLALPTGTRLRLGHAKVVDVTRLRNPCAQLDHLQPELMKTASDRDAEGNLVRKAGVMAIVILGGEVSPGDPIAVELPLWPHAPLVPV
jgi:MOSC domain-containing protein YiiM